MTDRQLFVAKPSVALYAVARQKSNHNSETHCIPQLFDVIHKQKVTKVQN